jgi:hypothetical protein
MVNLFCHSLTNFIEIRVAAGYKITTVFLLSHHHYARTLKRRRALTKKGDVRSACLLRCVTYYNVIGDARKYTSLISQYMRRALQTLISHYVKKLRRTIRVTRLVLDDCLSYSATNRRRMFSKARLRLAYAPSEFLQTVGCILELVRI